jgi:Mn-containing catalase
LTRFLAQNERAMLDHLLPWFLAQNLPEPVAALVIARMQGGQAAPLVSAPLQIAAPEEKRSTSAERTRRYREKQRQKASQNGHSDAGCDAGSDVLCDAESDASVTPLARDVVVVSESESKTTTTNNNSNNMGEGVQRERESEADAAAFAASFVEPGNEAAALVERLRSQGVLRHVAEELVRDCPAEVIRNQIAWLRERENAGSVKNLAGMLVDSIRGNWDPPPSVVRRQEAREKRERAEANRRRESEAAAERAAEADALWERMSPKARERIETELRARLPSPLDRFAAKDPDHPSVREWIDTERRARMLSELESAKP